MTTQLLWSLDEAAKAMGGISARTVRRLIQTGELPAIRIRGCAPRIRPEDVQTWIEQNIVRNHNNGARGSVPKKEESTCLTNRKTDKGSLAQSGGRVTQTQVARELDALLERQTLPKPKHLKQSGNLKPTTKKNGDVNLNVVSIR
ncbi:MAG: hypothetical protein DM484_19005 [Candidatus Methylumidiphilus alinenensis]|uniref:Helix-turn-helix domain-containing protein n=1 Tax=Candidatus Methylumidiphilus alinenensis TaxID=2202197 RepID=A0A2W4SRL4_9GAMM|nr:MAG: hypothetical protein DM484_19005 [Candidatus Methylumidiphilus alinenensis]